MGMFSFNQQGAVTAAQKANEAGIPIVTVDNVGQVLQPEYEVDVAAAIDFDWAGMGENYAEYIAENYPGAKIAVIAGILEHRPVQVITNAMQERVEELGENEIVEIVDGEYVPEVAVNKAQDLVQSGLEFDIIWIMDEDMAAAVIRYLKGQDLAEEYTIIAQNGSPAGMPLVKSGELDYTISSSPGWEGMVALLALHHYAQGNTAFENEQIMLPVIPVTQTNIDDPEKVVPWQPNKVWIDLTKEYFPELGQYLPDKNEVELPE
jgi:ribose transport system substrate-binding protein